MRDYIIESMALIGCGISDIKEIRKIVSTLSKKEIDILDTWHNLGLLIELKKEYQQDAERLKYLYSKDDLEVLSNYVSSCRNIGTL